MWIHIVSTSKLCTQFLIFLIRIWHCVLGEKMRPADAMFVNRVLPTSVGQGKSWMTHEHARTHTMTDEQKKSQELG